MRAEPARIVAVVTCKDRLEHLRATLPAMASAFTVVVVSYDCLDSYAWVHPLSVTNPQIHAISMRRDPEGPPFWKSRALNAGALHAIHLGATRLLFLDADTLVDRPSSLALALESLAWDEFACAGREHGVDRPGLTGVLCCTIEAFLTARGFDLRYRGWGLEDVDMRIELALTGSRVRWLSPGLLQPIKHADDLRTKHRAPGQLPQKSWSVTRAAFLDKWKHRLRLPELEKLGDLPAELKTLCFHNATIGGVYG